MKIITGSYNGILRILKPTSRNNKTEDLLLEQDVNRPILQIACGQFIGYL